MTKLHVTPNEITYSFRGKNLQKAIAATGLTQKEFSERLGFKGGSRVSHLCAKETGTLRESTLHSIATVLKANGVSVAGQVK